MYKKSAYVKIIREVVADGKVEALAEFCKGIISEHRSQRRLG